MRLLTFCIQHVSGTCPHKWVPFMQENGWGEESLYQVSLRPSSHTGNFQSLAIKYDVSCEFFIEPFIRLRVFPSTSSLLNVFIMEGCWILTNAFPTSIDIIILCFIFCLINMVY